MTTALASRIGGVVLLAAFLFVPARSSSQLLITRGPDFRGARQLKVLTVVIDESNRMWAPEALPDSTKLLEVLAKADVRITNNPAESTLDPARVSGYVQMGIDVDGIGDFVNFPLPSPDGSRPYRFWVSGKRANERGTPIYTLQARDAEALGAILRPLEAQQPAP